MEPFSSSQLSISQMLDKIVQDEESRKYKTQEKPHEIKSKNVNLTNFNHQSQHINNFNPRQHATKDPNFCSYESIYPNYVMNSSSMQPKNNMGLQHFVPNGSKLGTVKQFSGASNTIHAGTSFGIVPQNTPPNMYSSQSYLGYNHPSSNFPGNFSTPIYANSPIMYPIPNPYNPQNIPEAPQTMNLIPAHSIHSSVSYSLPPPPAPPKLINSASSFLSSAPMPSPYIHPSTPKLPSVPKPPSTPPLPPSSTFPPLPPSPPIPPPPLPTSLPMASSMNTYAPVPPAHSNYKRMSQEPAKSPSARLISNSASMYDSEASSINSLSSNKFTKNNLHSNTKTSVNPLSITNSDINSNIYHKSLLVNNNGLESKYSTVKLNKTDKMKPEKVYSERDKFSKDAKREKSNNFDDDSSYLIKKKHTAKDNFYLKNKISYNSVLKQSKQYHHAYDQKDEAKITLSKEIHYISTNSSKDKVLRCSSRNDDFKAARNYIKEVRLTKDVKHVEEKFSNSNAKYSKVGKCTTEIQNTIDIMDTKDRHIESSKNLKIAKIKLVDYELEPGECLSDSDLDNEMDIESGPSYSKNDDKFPPHFDDTLPGEEKKHFNEKEKHQKWTLPQEEQFELHSKPKFPRYFKDKVAFIEDAPDLFSDDIVTPVATKKSKSSGSSIKLSKVHNARLDSLHCESFVSPIPSESLKCTKTPLIKRLGLLGEEEREAEICDQREKEQEEYASKYKKENESEEYASKNKKENKCEEFISRVKKGNAGEEYASKVVIKNESKECLLKVVEKEELKNDFKISELTNSPKSTLDDSSSNCNKASSSFVSSEKMVENIEHLSKGFLKSKDFPDNKKENILELENTISPRLEISNKFDCKLESHFRAPSPNILNIRISNDPKPLKQEDMKLDNPKVPKPKTGIKSFLTPQPPEKKQIIVSPSSSRLDLDSRIKILFGMKGSSDEESPEKKSTEIPKIFHYKNMRLLSRPPSPFRSKNAYHFWYKETYYHRKNTSTFNYVDPTQRQKIGIQIKEVPQSLLSGSLSDDTHHQKKDLEVCLLSSSTDFNKDNKNLRSNSSVSKRSKVAQGGLSATLVNVSVDNEMELVNELPLESDKSSKEFECLKVSKDSCRFSSLKDKRDNDALCDDEVVNLVMNRVIEELKNSLKRKLTQDFLNEGFLDDKDFVHKKISKFV